MATTLPPADLPILYSFRRCPYAMRARWSLLESGLLVQWREIALKAKPPEMLQASQKGTVPVLVLGDGTVIDESRAVIAWALNQADPRQLLQAGDAEALIAENDGPFKHHLDRFKYTDRYPGADREQHRSAGLAILRSWSQRLTETDWLLGSRLSLADVALWLTMVCGKSSSRLSNIIKAELGRNPRALKKEGHCIAIVSPMYGQRNASFSHS